MCLGLPGKVLEVDGREARVDFWGIVRKVRVDVLEEELAPGDYVVNHAGFAVRRIPPEQVADTLGMYELVLAEAAGDPTAGDVERELASLPK